MQPRPRNKGAGLRVRFKVMGTSPKGIVARRVLASVSLGGAAAGFAAIALAPGSFFTVSLLVFAGVVAAGAVGLGMKSVSAQVLARGVGWTVLAPSLLGAVEALSRGHAPDAHTLFFGATSGAALALARPLLHTPAARAAFAPVAYRRTFAAGAVAAATAGTASALFAVGTLLWGSTGSGAALALLGATLIAAALGVARMRAWGVLLAMVGSLGALVAAIVSGSGAVGAALALAAIPGVILTFPLVAARLGIAGSPPTSTPSVRVGAEDAFVRPRVVVTEGELEEQPAEAALATTTRS